jgi:putative nucleotidyltransferase with HDIG domain
MSRKWVPWNNQTDKVWSVDPGSHDLLIETNVREVNAWTTEVAGRSCTEHDRRVMDLSLKLAETAGLLHGEWEVRQVIWAALLHDIGKAAISARILEKPGPLTPAEFKTIQQHPSLGHRLARTAPQADDAVLGAILHHHERWDGEGYPLGLIGESIPLLARIIKVTDVYDALVSDRPYRAAWTADEATAYLLQHSGTAFDPRLIQIFAHRVLPQQQHSGFPLD